MGLEILKERHGGVLIVALEGRLDNESNADFELFAQEAMAAGERHLVLDLSALGYISNAGLRVLGSLAKSLKTPTTSLRVAGPSEAVRQVFDAAGVAMLFDIHPSRAAALKGHPAALQNQLGEHMARLLGAEALAPATKDSAKLAEKVFELLAGSQQSRAARAVAQGTQVMRRIIQPPTGAAAGGPAAGAAAGKKAGFWSRLFGRKS